MKGLLKFLERAGLVTTEPSSDVSASAVSTTAYHSADFANPSAVAYEVADSDAQGLDLQQVYAQYGLTSAAFPAERLLRLIDGLSTMDEANRQIAIGAMDVADDSWSIGDVLADASKKIDALTLHRTNLEEMHQEFEREVQTNLNALSSHQDKVVSDIQQQIAELQNLIERELQRTQKEREGHEARLSIARQTMTSDVAKINRFIAQFQRLTIQFNSRPNP